MPLGTKIDLSQGVIVLDGDPTPSPRKGAQQPSTVAKRLAGSLGTEVGLGPGHVVLHGDLAPPGNGHSSFIRFSHISTSGLCVGASRASFIAVFAISCTRCHVSRSLRSHWTLNDAHRRYFRFGRNRK